MPSLIRIHWCLRVVQKVINWWFLNIMYIYKRTTVWKNTNSKKTAQRVLNAAVRLVSNTRKYDRGLTYIRRNVLHWLDVTDRVHFRVCVQVFKCLHGMAPGYLSTMCHPVSRLSGRQNLRSANCGSSTSRALHCRRAMFEPSRMLVHLCGTLCPFISRTAIWLL